MAPRRIPYPEREIFLLFARFYGAGPVRSVYEAPGDEYPVGQALDRGPGTKGACLTCSLRVGSHYPTWSKFFSIAAARTRPTGS